MPRPRFTCYYGVLEVQPTATPEQLKKAFRQQALRWHPDKNPDCAKAAEEQFKLVSEAYQTLSDPHKKLQYDAARAEWLQLQASLQRHRRRRTCRRPVRSRIGRPGRDSQEDGTFWSFGGNTGDIISMFFDGAGGGLFSAFFGPAAAHSYSFDEECEENLDELGDDDDLEEDLFADDLFFDAGFEDGLGFFDVLHTPFQPQKPWPSQDTRARSRNRRRSRHRQRHFEPQHRHSQPAREAFRARSREASKPSRHAHSHQQRQRQQQQQQQHDRSFSSTQQKARASQDRHRYAQPAGSKRSPTPASSHPFHARNSHPRSDPPKQQQQASRSSRRDRQRRYGQRD